MFIKQGSWIRILVSSWIYSISEKLKKKKQKKCTEIRNNRICIKIFKINLDQLQLHGFLLLGNLFCLFKLQKTLL